MVSPSGGWLGYHGDISNYNRDLLRMIVAVPYRMDFKMG
jgi:hypothetical protein